MTQTITQSAGAVGGAWISFADDANAISHRDFGGQLKQVAQIMQARSALGLQRQIFFCSLGGFDTHSAQLVTQQTLCITARCAALSAFYNATVGIGHSRSK